MSELRGRRPKTSKEEINEFLHKAPSGSLDMLRVFAEADTAGSFALVAARLGVEPRTVNRNLKKLNDLFKAMTGGGELFLRPNVNYVLTDAGKLIGQDLVTQHRRLGEAVMRAASKHTEAWIPVTSNCISDLKRLQRRVEKDKSIILYPDPHRSADLLPPIFQRRQNRAIQERFALAMFSMCADASDLTERTRGNVVGRDPAEVMVLRIEPFRVLAETRIFGTAEVLSIEDIWDRCQLIVPDGGAVRTFLNEIAGSWEPIREYLEGTDLDCCLACLSNHSVPDPAMIVHGYHGELPEGFSLYDISDQPELAAVTGVFHRPELYKDLGSKKWAIWSEIWLSAQNEYSRETHGSGWRSADVR